MSGFYRFKWSGVNGARSRLIASSTLAANLNDLSRAFPDSDIVVISHSHGGNVVAWASAHLERPLAASVYLNTPFIQVLPQDEGSHKSLRFALVFTFPFIWVILDSIAAVLPFPARWTRSGLIVLGATAAVMGILQVLVPPRIDEIREELSDVSNDRRRIHKELAVYVTGDEAAAGLGAVYFLQWITNKSRLWLFGGALCTAAVSAVFKTASGTADRIVPWLIEVFLATFLIFLIVAISAHGLVQGLVALDSSLTVTPSPVGESDFVTIGWTNKDRLRHSLVYGSPEAVTAIINWLERTLSSFR